MLDKAVNDSSQHQAFHGLGSATALPWLPDPVLRPSNLSSSLLRVCNHRPEEDEPITDIADTERKMR